MLRLIDQIGAAYDAMPRRSIKVREWGDVEIFYKPLTGEEYDTVQAELEGGRASGPRNNAQVVIVKALDANGVRLFKNDDAELLMQKGFIETFARIASAMTQVIKPDDAGKN